MTTAEPVEATSPQKKRNVVVFCVAWSLVAGCLVLIGTLFVAGERVTSYEELRAAVASGEVDEIRVAGGLGDGQVLGAVAFLLLGGSTARWPTSAPREGRFTGGWAFLIAFLVGSALSTTAAFTF